MDYKLNRFDLLEETLDTFYLKAGEDSETILTSLVDLADEIQEITVDLDTGIGGGLGVFMGFNSTEFKLNATGDLIEDVYKGTEWLIVLEVLDNDDVVHMF